MGLLITTDTLYGSCGYTLYGSCAYILYGCCAYTLEMVFACQPYQIADLLQSYVNDITSLTNTDFAHRMRDACRHATMIARLDQIVQDVDVFIQEVGGPTPPPKKRAKPQASDEDISSSDPLITDESGSVWTEANIRKANEHIANSPKPAEALSALLQFMNMPTIDLRPLRQGEAAASKAEAQKRVAAKAKGQDAAAAKAKGSKAVATRQSAPTAAVTTSEIEAEAAAAVAREPNAAGYQERKAAAAKVAEQMDAAAKEKEKQATAARAAAAEAAAREEEKRREEDQRAAVARAQQAADELLAEEEQAAAQAAAKKAKKQRQKAKKLQEQQQQHDKLEELRKQQQEPQVEEHRQQQHEDEQRQQRKAKQEQLRRQEQVKLQQQTAAALLKQQQEDEMQQQQLQGQQNTEKLRLMQPLQGKQNTEKLRLMQPLQQQDENCMQQRIGQQQDQASAQQQHKYENKSNKQQEQPLLSAGHASSQPVSTAHAANGHASRVTSGVRVSSKVTQKVPAIRPPGKQISGDHHTASSEADDHHLQRQQHAQQLEYQHAHWHAQQHADNAQDLNQQEQSLALNPDSAGHFGHGLVVTDSGNSAVAHDARELERSALTEAQAKRLAHLWRLLCCPITQVLLTQDLCDGIKHAQGIAFLALNLSHHASWCLVWIFTSLSSMLPCACCALPATCG